jgi:virulence factor Mce-like protein
MTRRIATAIVTAALLVTTLSACNAISVNSLPQPGKSFSDGYDVVLQFASVLNLPDQAKVVMGGTEIGRVTKVEATSSGVDVTAQLARGVVVPSDVTAALEQATILGDIYVSLDQPDPASAAPPLKPGGIVPVQQTLSPPQLEDTLAHLADFVASGSIQRLQNTITGVNRVSPPQPQLRKLATQVTADLRDLSDNIDTVDTLLTGVSQTGQALNTKLSSAQFWFSPRGMRGFDFMFQETQYLAKLFPSVGSVYTGGYWLVPLLNSLRDATGAMVQSKWAFEDEFPAWQKMFNDLFLPQDQNPAINITSIVGPDGRELSGNTADVLRMLGAMP